MEKKKTDFLLLEQLMAQALISLAINELKDYSRINITPYSKFEPDAPRRFSGFVVFNDSVGHGHSNFLSNDRGRNGVEFLEQRSQLFCAFGHGVQQFKGVYKFQDIRGIFVDDCGVQSLEYVLFPPK